MLPLHLHLDNSIGLGHKMRCAALAQAWRRQGGRVKQVKRANCGEPAVHVFDGYSWKDADRQRARAAGGIVLAISDGEPVGGADVILNQNLGATEAMYDDAGARNAAPFSTATSGFMTLSDLEAEYAPPPSQPLLLLGPKYFLLRAAFGVVRRPPDPLRSLSIAGVFDCDAARRSVAAGDFAARMASAQVIVCAAGITAYEALYLGVPVLLRLAAENQRLTYESLLAGGFALRADKVDPLRLTASERRLLAERGMSLVDGHGADRVAEVLWGMAEHA